MDSSINFDATAVPPATGTPDPLPPAVYLVHVDSMEKVPNSAGWGVKTVLVVLDGPYKGQRIFEQYNLQHTNETAVRIANEQFSALCHVTGVTKPRQLGELLRIPFAVKVKIEPAKDGYEAKNRITQYLYKDGSKIGAGGVVGSVSPAKAKSAAAPEWAAARKAG